MSKIVLCLGLLAAISTSVAGVDQPSIGNAQDNAPAVAAECAPPRVEHEDLHLTLEQYDPKWTPGYTSDHSPRYSIVEFIREGDNINDWHELLSIQMFPRLSWGSPSPQDTLNSLKDLRQQQCPGSTQWNVIENKWDSILYEFQAKPCQGWPEQHEIARIVYGKYNRFVFHYVAKVYELQPVVRTMWIKKFAEARIVLRCR